MRIICLSTDAGDGTVLEKGRPEIARFISDQACSVLLVVLLISCVRKNFCVLCPNLQMPLKDISNPSVRRIWLLFVLELYSCRCLWGLYLSPLLCVLACGLSSACLQNALPGAVSSAAVCAAGNRVVRGFGNSTKDPATIPLSRETAGYI